MSSIKREEEVRLGFALDCLIGTLEICRLAIHSFGSKAMYLPIGRG
jgi:hypothetical protein